MSRYTQSRTAFPITLELYEVEGLIEWHRDAEFKAADEQDYSTAEGSKSRREALEELLKARREVIQAEALEQTKKNLAAQNKTPARDWHYDSQGYCDNPGRGY